jgi:hypothetical protein
MAARSPGFQKAMRFARRGKACRSEPDRRATWRQMVSAMLRELPPKVDGTHPLDAQNLKLTGE